MTTPDQDPKEPGLAAVKVPESRPEAIDPLERIKTEYKAVIDLRDDLYQEDIKAARKDDPKKARFLEGQLGVLRPHNETVLDYGLKLTETLDLTADQRVTAILAIILHDSGKLNSPLLEHHIGGAARAEEILNQVSDLQFEGVEITPQIIDKVKQATLRHMNHPFLVIVMRKGERFPEPENEVDKIVFDSDMLANVGFKNVGFRLNNPGFLATDAAAAAAKGIPALQESFSNVMEGATGARGLKDVVLLEQSKQIIADNISKVDQIYRSLAEQGVFQQVQDEFSQDGLFSVETIQAKGGIAVIQKRLNEEVFKAAMTLGIDKKSADKFKI